jgi:hypothetical protein
MSVCEGQGPKVCVKGDTLDDCTSAQDGIAYTSELFLGKWKNLPRVECVSANELS